MVDLDVGYYFYLSSLAVRMQHSLLCVFLNVVLTGCNVSAGASLDTRIPGAKKSSLSLLTEGRRLRNLGKFAEASRQFQLAAGMAAKMGQDDLRAEALLARTACEIRLFHYSIALQAVQIARISALRAKDYTIAGAADINLSVIYSQLGDFAAGREAADEAVAYLSGSSRRDYYSAALANKGESDFGLHDIRSGTASFRKAIETAQDARLPRYEAVACDHLGIWLMLEGDLKNAEVELLRAKRMFESQGDKDQLAGLYEHLAELECAKGGTFLRSALTHIDLSFATKSISFQTSPQYYPIHIRGQILLSLGFKDKALAEFRRSVLVADLWRQSALPGDTTKTQTVAQLDAVYRDCAQLTAKLSLERDDPGLAREAFEVLERNRASSLREQLTVSYREKLMKSTEYFSLLQRLQAEQASVTLGQTTSREDSHRRSLNQIRTQLGALENQIGLSTGRLGLSPAQGNRFASVAHLQRLLKPSEVVLSFSLGEKQSMLWAVTHDGLKLYGLPSRATIAKAAAAFSTKVLTNGLDRMKAARSLSHLLFQGLAPSLKEKRDWLLVLDDALLSQIPFSALPDPTSSNEALLIRDHTLRTLPSAFLFRLSGIKVHSGRFIGVADPIYNLADSRRKYERISPSTTKTPSAVLSRLTATDVEVRASAEKCGLLSATLLTGSEASGKVLRQKLRPYPEIVHFAVHIVSPKEFPQEAAIALSLATNRMPELLTAESVSNYQVPGALVVLSGCASQQGEVLPGAGLIGLSRGWILAGASAVIVTAWPTPDSSGLFFPIFYDNYRNAQGTVGSRAAEALRQTQLRMQQTQGYESDPSFWAAYSILAVE